MDEVRRIEEAYARRRSLFWDDRYSLLNDAALFALQQRERKFLAILKRHNITPLHDKRILDVGCGMGGELRRFIEYGADPRNLFGVDLLAGRIETARRLSPNIEFVCGNAENLPYGDESFDLVLQFTVFTSILDPKTKRNISREMLRISKKEGMIVWYDYHCNNPRNPDVRGVRKGEIVSLFPGCRIELHRITLAPPITRLLAPSSWLLCYMLERIAFLCTHYLGVIRKG